MNKLLLRAFEMCVFWRMLQICDENCLVQKEVKDPYNKGEKHKKYEASAILLLKSFSAIFRLLLRKPPKFLKLLPLLSV